LEEFPLFRLSDTADDNSISYPTDDGGRWRVLASPGDRLPGTFDQDVYIEVMRRFQEANEPSDGAISFTLHAFLRSMGRQADGRTYEQLRSSLTGEHTVLQSSIATSIVYPGGLTDANFTLLSSVMIERRSSGRTSSPSFRRSLPPSRAGTRRCLTSRPPECCGSPLFR
jgi:plasmid replication initiation protein